MVPMGLVLGTPCVIVAACIKALMLQVRCTARSSSCSMGSVCRVFFITNTILGIERKTRMADNPLENEWSPS